MNKFISKKEILSYLSNRGKKHKTYKRYSGREKIIRDLEQGYLILSDGSNWEDRCDSSSFQKNTKNIKRYSLCFAYGNTENVAMWLIYANIKKEEGLMVSIPNKIMTSIIKDSEEVELGVYENNIFRFKKNSLIKKIYLTDLYYTSGKGDEIICTVGDEHYRISNKLFYDTMHLSKNYSWRFENECRLIVEVEERNNYNYTAARIKLKESVKNLIIRECLIDDPVNEMNEFKESSLHGSIRF